MLKDIKAIMFDAADTLFYIREGLGKTYASPANKYGIDPEPDQIKKAFSKYFPEAPPLAFPHVSDQVRKVMEKSWWYEVVKNVYEDIGMFDQFDSYFDELFEIFRTSAWDIFPETKTVLSQLKKSGYTIIIVSNFDSRVYDVFDNLGISGIPDDFIISSEAGYAKPDLEIYRLALKRNSLSPSECIFIGDNYLNDYITPISIGMNALLLNRENENEKYAVKRINSLSDLLQ